MSYSDLTDGEQAHWNEYENLRGISDWPGFDADQDRRRADARAWLVARRKEIWRSAQPASEGGDGNGWGHANRQARYDFLSDDNLNAGAPKHEYRLPAPATMTDAEKVYVEEREVYLVFDSTTDEQKARKTANLSWLQDRRKQLWHLIEDSSDDENKANDRPNRYDALCVATHHGQAWEDYEKTHNAYGVAYSEDEGDGSRSWCRDHANAYVGVHENPSGSNTGREQPSGWQDRVYGDDGVAWCACYATCMAQDAGVAGAGSAAVSYCMDMAKKGQGIYRGWTTDPAKVHTGDHAVISCSTCHIGVVTSPPYGCTEGNTSASNGSNFNGGEVAKHDRQGNIVGWCLVRFDD